MTTGIASEKQIQSTVQKVIEDHGASIDELIPVLLEINSTLGYLPSEAIKEVSKTIKLPISRVASVASFYSMFSDEPRGRHVVQFCESAPCHVMGGRLVWQVILNKIGINAGETSHDGKWSLVTTSCLGICGVGPVMIVDDQVYGNLTPQKVSDILDQLD
jgi:NADH:ubiquinone oxidoreductase subunit E